MVRVPAISMPPFNTAPVTRCPEGGLLVLLLLSCFKAMEVVNGVLIKHYCRNEGSHNALCRVTHGVTVSMSAFLACHQCYCTGSSLAWALNLQVLVCGIF